MNRIDQKFQALRAAGQKGFIVYVSAGDPNLKATSELAQEFERIGVDVLELGVPFSDPLADGIVNQMAAERALRNGTTLDGVFKSVAALRKSGCEIPIVFYIYYNLIHCHGLKKFAKDAAAAGVDGVLALDLPPEEGGEFEKVIRQAGLHLVYLVAPTTPKERIREIAGHASGFIYYVSRIGVTGMQKSLATSIHSQVGMIRRHTKLPIAVGFGISTPEQARAAADESDAVVVGSAIVNQIAKLGKDPNMVKKVSKFVAPMVKAVHAS